MIADDGHELTYDERVAVMMALGSSEGDAQFMLAIQDGEITGDLEEVSEEEVARIDAGNARRQASSPR